MNPQEVIAAIDAFVMLHIHGTQHPKAKAAFPGLPDLDGVHLRRPAVVGEPPDYEAPTVSPVDGEVFEPGDGPEASDEPYVFSDRCALADAVVRAQGTRVQITFTAICDFPGNEFPLELAVPVDELQRRRVLLPTALGECLWAAEECLDRLQDFLGVELTSVDLTHTVELRTWEDVHG